MKKGRKNETKESCTTEWNGKETKRKETNKKTKTKEVKVKKEKKKREREGKGREGKMPILVVICYQKSKENIQLKKGEK